MTYYTVVIPYSNTPSLWHPTDKTGPFSTLTRGAFDSMPAAIEWADSRLNNQPYTIEVIDYE